MKEYLYVISCPVELVKLGVARKPKPVAASRRGSLPATSTRPEFVERSAVVTADIVIPLQLLNVLLDLASPNDVEQSAVEDQTLIHALEFFA